MHKDYLQDVFEWDVYNWSRALSFWKANSNLNLKESSALEIGARNGGLSIWLSHNCKEVTCSDRENPKQNALPLHTRYNCNNISYASLDATQLDSREQYDLIVTKSVLSGFDNLTQEKVLLRIYNALRFGGEYWFAENLKATWVHQFMRKKFIKWGKTWNYLDFKDLPSAFDQFDDAVYKTIGFLGAFGRNNFQRNVLGAFDHIIFENITPKGMRYILVGVARK